MSYAHVKVVLYMWLIVVQQPFTFFVESFCYVLLLLCSRVYFKVMDSKLFLGIVFYLDKSVYVWFIFYCYRLQSTLSSATKTSKILQMSLSICFILHYCLIGQSFSSSSSISTTTRWTLNDLICCATNINTYLHSVIFINVMLEFAS